MYSDYRNLLSSLTKETKRKLLSREEEIELFSEMHHYRDKMVRRLLRIASVSRSCHSSLVSGLKSRSAFSACTIHKRGPTRRDRVNIAAMGRLLDRNEALFCLAFSKMARAVVPSKADAALRELRINKTRITNLAIEVGLRPRIVQTAYSDFRRQAEKDNAKVLSQCTAGELQKLIERMETYNTGYLYAKSTISHSNQGLVISIVNRTPSSADKCTMIAEGNIGLSKAIDIFDPQQGCRFSTMATMWIWDSVKRVGHREARVVQIPSVRHASLIAFQWDVSRLQHSLGKVPSVEEIATHLNLTDGEVVARLHQSDNSIAYMGTGVEDESNPEAMVEDSNAICPQGEAEVSELRKTLDDRLRFLMPDERRAVELRYLNGGLSVKEIAGILGVSRQRVEVMLSQALDELRDPIHADKLENFLPSS